MLSTQRVLRSTLLGLIASAIGASSNAQVTMRVHAKTKLHAGSQSVPANTDITTGVLFWSRGKAPCFATASLTVQVSNPATVRFCCSSSSNCAQAPSAGGSIRIRLAASKATSGFLLVHGDCPGQSSGFSIDVGGVGLLIAGGQFTGQRVLETPLVVGPKALDLVVHCNAAAWRLPPASADLTISFVPGATTSAHIKMIGRPCGPVLAPRFVQNQQLFGPVRVFDLAASEATSTSSWFVFGTKQQSVQIPPPGCYLHTDVALPIWAIANVATGRAHLTLPIPRGTPSGAQVYVQFVQATLRSNRLQWTTSEAALLRL